jgi:hypothetical protein
MLADEPELLAIADALVETQHHRYRHIRPARGWKPLVVVAAVIVALAGAGVGIAAGVGAFQSPATYSAAQVEDAFASEGIQLHEVTPDGYGGLLVMLDARPDHAVYVTVSISACKCLFRDPISNADEIHHGNVDVLYDESERAAVDAALEKLP